MFTRVDTALPGVAIIQPQVFGDGRGFFCETYHMQNFADLGIKDHFVQDNHSHSTRHILRGLHFQLQHPQSKLCRVVRGEVLDVAVDIRLGAPTFGKHVSVVLSEENHKQIYVPAGFAHGFVVISDEADFLYKCSDFYDPSDEYGVHWSDPDLAIEWGVRDPLLSEKDRRLPRLKDMPEARLPRYHGAAE